MATPGEAQASTEFVNVREAARRYYAKRRDRCVHADGSLAVIIASAAVVREAHEELATGYLRHEIKADPYPRWVILGHEEALACALSRVPSESRAVPSHFGLVNATIDAIARTPSVGAWLARRKPAELRAASGSAFRSIESVLSDPDRAKLADSLRRADGVASASDLHLATDAQSPAARQELGWLMQLRSGYRWFGENIVNSPLQVGAGNKVNVGLLEFYRGVLLHFLAQRIGRPSPMDMADLSMYWQLEDGVRLEIRNRWRARLAEPWTKEIEWGVRELFGDSHGNDGQLTRELRYPCAATSFLLAML